MSNVFSNASFAVLSVMHIHDTDNAYKGSTVFCQKKPENDYPNLAIYSFSEGGNVYGLEQSDFDVQVRFDANVVPKIQTLFDDKNTGNVTLSNSAISSASYKPDGTLIT
tara:strand:+ start:1593 stop:1919 length:327 start_codon:yes stop_codon:yes gene_type:complete